MTAREEPGSRPEERPSTGTGWSEQDSPASLSERLQRLETLAGRTRGDGTGEAAQNSDGLGRDDRDDDRDDDLDDFVDLDDLDDLDDAEDPEVQAQLDLLARRAGAGSASSGAAGAAGSVTVAGAATEVLPTSVPGLGARSRARSQRGKRAERRVATRRRISIPVLVLTLLTLVAGAVTAKVWLDVRSQSQAEDARRSGLEASRDAARLLFSYDYRTLDKDFATGRRLTTGSFRIDYDKTTTRVVADVAQRYKAVVKANVINAGVVSATPSRVVTVVYVNQVTSSTQVKGQKVDLSRVRMTLVRVDGVWLVTKVDAL